MSYWITAFNPWARSGLKRPVIASNVSLTVISTSSTVGATGRDSASLSPLELRGTLLEEGLNPFPSILGAEGLEEGVDLGVDSLRQRPVEPPIHALDDEPRRDRCPSRDGRRQRTGFRQSLPL